MGKKMYQALPQRGSYYCAIICYKGTHPNLLSYLCVNSSLLTVWAMLPISFSVAMSITA